MKDGHNEPKHPAAQARGRRRSQKGPSLKQTGSLGGKARSKNLAAQGLLSEVNAEAGRRGANARWNAFYAAKARAAGIDPAGLSRDQIRKLLKKNRSPQKKA